jgi:hypothetical protein
MINFNKIKLSVNIIGSAYVTELKKQLEQSGSIATRDLYNSIKYSAIIKSNRIDLKVVSLPYLYWIDKGRRATGKRPPYEPILTWVKAKGIDWKTPSGKTMKKESVAFAIQNILKDKDTPPKGVIQKTRINILNNKQLMDELAQSAAKDISVFAMTVLKDLKNPTIKNT